MLGPGVPGLSQDSEILGRTFTAIAAFPRSRATYGSRVRDRTTPSSGRSPHLMAPHSPGEVGIPAEITQRDDLVEQYRRPQARAVAQPEVAVLQELYERVDRLAPILHRSRTGQYALIVRGSQFR